MNKALMRIDALLGEQRDKKRAISIQINNFYANYGHLDDARVLIWNTEIHHCDRMIEKLLVRRAKVLKMDSAS